MILDEFVEVRWNRSNKEHFINLGYVFSKMRNTFIVKTHDLCKYSRTKIHVKCDVCEKEVIISYELYNRSTNNNNYFACSKKCGTVKMKKNNLEKYGFEYPQQNKQIKAKSVKTTLERYGFENVFQNEKIKEKLKQTNLKKYGVEYPQQNIEIKEKSKQTNLKKYGFECSLQNIVVRERIKRTNLNKYGFENVFQNEKIKEKSKQTNLKKYGVENISQLESIKEKKRISCIEKYGEIYFKYVPRYNVNSIFYLDLLSEKLKLPIQHALNGGEKKFRRYSIDGYIDKHNICIEWDERGHNVKKQKENDLLRELFLIKNFECQIIRINEREFLKDIENQMNLISKKISVMINNPEVFIKESI